MINSWKIKYLNSNKIYIIILAKFNKMMIRVQHR